jgi:tRNA threonylcarbamoyladenosine biosynthesis protein TsaB
MLILALDTSTPSGSLAVLRDRNLLGVIAIDSRETYSSRLFRHLDYLLAELGLEMAAFDLFAVVVGPGSFSGLRVGLAATKGWAEVYGKPVAAVSALEAMAGQVALEDALLVPIMDARRGQIFAGLYRWQKGALAQVELDCVQTFPDFLAELKSRKDAASAILISPDPESLAPSLAASPFARATVMQSSRVLAPWVGLRGHLRAAKGELLDSLTLDANYVRRSDAEMNWKGT